MEVMTAIESDVFRRVMGHFVTGVTVVPALDGDRPFGITRASPGRAGKARSDEARCVVARAPTHLMRVCISSDTFVLGPCEIWVIRGIRRA